MMITSIPASKVPISQLPFKLKTLRIWGAEKDAGKLVDFDKIENSILILKYLNKFETFFQRIFKTNIFILDIILERD